jgi:hypothetical protein
MLSRPACPAGVLAPHQPAILPGVQGGQAKYGSYPARVDEAARDEITGPLAGH